MTVGARWTRRVLWVGFGLFFLFPLYAMADFSTRSRDGRTIPRTDGRFPRQTDDFWEEKNLKNQNVE